MNEGAAPQPDAHPGETAARVDTALLSSDDIARLMQARHVDPFACLGMHEIDGQIVVRALLPTARTVEVVDARGRRVAALQRLPHGDVFAVTLPRRRQRFPYRLRVQWQDGNGGPGLTSEIEDAYRFGPQLTDLDVWLLAEGTHHRPYEWLGAHPVVVDGIAGTRFAVWAPNARRVSVVGGFNNWNGRRHMMRLRRECGVWEIFLPHVGDGDLYKYEVLGCDGIIRIKADPFAFRAELRPQTASVVQRLLPGVAIDDERRRANALDAPISIYEVHLGSWQRKADGNWLSYRELAERLIPTWSSTASPTSS